MTAAPFPQILQRTERLGYGMPPIVKMQQLGLEPSLSTDVETNMTADFFTQMRSAMTMQRLVVNQAVLNTGDFVTFPTGTWPPH